MMINSGPLTPPQNLNLETKNICQDLENSMLTIIVLKKKLEWSDFKNEEDIF